MTKTNQELEWRIDKDFVDYDYALDVMETRAAAIHNGEAGEMVWLLEHPPLYTAGTSANPADLIDPDRFPVYDAGRGGEYTYHGPGQRVVYFMLDLSKRGKDLRKFIYNLEAVIIEAIEEATGIRSERREGRVGVWVTRDDGREEKIAAIGVRVRRWVSFHGIAINVSPNLEHFEGIVPCGIAEHGVTSFVDMGSPKTMEDLDRSLKTKFEEICGLEIQPMKYSWQPSPMGNDAPSVDPLVTHPTFQV